MPFDVANDNFIYSFGDTSVYVYGGDNELLYSNDGGQSWSSKFRVPELFNPQDFIFTSPDKGYMFTYYSGSYDSRLYEIGSYGDSLKLIAVDPNTIAMYFANNDPNNFKFHGTNWLGPILTVDPSSNIISALSADLFLVSVAPNPSFGYITINGADINSKVSIFNTDGKIEISRVIKNNTQVIDINELASGNYFITFSSQSGRKSIKFVKL